MFNIFTKIALRFCRGAVFTMLDKFVGLCYNKNMEQSKKLSEMTIEELWQLFPIFLTEHNPDWEVWYGEEITCLKGILPQYAEYYHIGSTAIKEIWAKPIVDILIVVKTKAQLQALAEILQQNGYILMFQSENRISLNKGYTEQGFAERVFHLHLRLENDIDELYFGTI